MTHKDQNLLDHLLGYIVKRRWHWHWTGGIANGSPQARVPGSSRRVNVARAIYRLLVAPIPEGHQVFRLCGRDDCVRPACLRAATASEVANVVKHRHSVTTPAQRRAIRKAMANRWDRESGVAAVARRIGISKQAAYHIAWGNAFPEEPGAVESGPKVKIRPDQRRRLRDAYDNGENITALAREMGLKRQTAYACASRQTWAWEEAV